MNKCFLKWWILCGHEWFGSLWSDNNGGDALDCLVYSKASLISLSLSIYFRCMAAACLIQNLFLFIRFAYPLKASLPLIYSTIWSIMLWNCSYRSRCGSKFPFRFKITRKALFQSLGIAFVINFNMIFYWFVLIGINSFFKILKLSFFVCFFILFLPK